MKAIKLIFICLLISSFSFQSKKIDTKTNFYDESFVEYESVDYKGEEYKMVWMIRSGKRIKAKYFAYETSGMSVASRYKQWKVGKDIVMYTSGTYMDKNAELVGITIDNGYPLNQKVETTRMDGLAIVYATGGIAVSNIQNGDLNISGGSAGNGKSIDLTNARDQSIFIDWAKDQNATVFQTHLLAFKDELKFRYNHATKDNKRERRFLAIGYDANRKIIHSIIHKEENYSLYEASKRILDFLQNKRGMEVIALLNLDTGVQDVCQVFNYDGSKNNLIKGKADISAAKNLLVYYYE